MAICSVNASSLTTNNRQTKTKQSICIPQTKSFSAQSLITYPIPSCLIFIDCQRLQNERQTESSEQNPWGVHPSADTKSWGQCGEDKRGVFVSTGWGECCDVLIENDVCWVLHLLLLLLPPLSVNPAKSYAFVSTPIASRPCKWIWHLMFEEGDEEKFPKCKIKQIRGRISHFAVNVCLDLHCLSSLCFKVKQSRTVSFEGS